MRKFRTNLKEYPTEIINGIRCGSSDMAPASSKDSLTFRQTIECSL